MNRKAKYGVKQIKNTRTGFSSLSVDFVKKEIIKWDLDKETTMIKFPEEWDKMDLKQQKEWLLTKLEVNKYEEIEIKRELIKVRNKIKW